jgi:hypothetical protein
MSRAGGDATHVPRTGGVGGRGGSAQSEPVHLQAPSVLTTMNPSLQRCVMLKGVRRMTLTHGRCR